MMVLYLAIPVNIGLICFTFDMLGDGEKLPASRVWIFFLLTLAACIFEFALERLVPDKDVRTLTQEQRQVYICNLAVHGMLKGDAASMMENAVLLGDRSKRKARIGNRIIAPIAFYLEQTMKFWAQMLLRCCRWLMLPLTVMFCCSHLFGSRADGWRTGREESSARNGLGCGCGIEAAAERNRQRRRNAKKSERRAKRREKKVQLKRLLELHVSDQRPPRNGSIEGKTPNRVLKNRPVRE